MAMRQVTREGQEEIGEISRPQAPTAPVGGDTPTLPGQGTPNADAGVSSPDSPPRSPATPPPAPPPSPVPVPPPPVQFDIAGEGEGASSFARPGSAAARPFRSMSYLTSRLLGGGRQAGFGAGAPVVGGAQGAASFTGSQDMAGDMGGEDELARIMANISGRYR